MEERGKEPSWPMYLFLPHSLWLDWKLHFISIHTARLFTALLPLSALKTGASDCGIA